MQPLEPTSYHRRLCDTLSTHEPGLFRWYGSDEYEAERSDRMRLELLRSSYRLSKESHERPHRLAREAASAVGVDVPVVLYQLHGGDQANAGLFFAADEAHVVLSGNLLGTLGDPELKALLGHELAHHRLLTMEGGRFRVTAGLIEACATHRGAHAAFVESAARNRLWTEVFADRGAAIAAGGVEPAIACLVKVASGLSEVSVADYLAQAREVVAKLGSDGSRDRSTHPETAVRAVALELWGARGAEADTEITAMIEGATTLESLDVTQQRELAERTRVLIHRVLAPRWMRTDATLAHARAFVPDYAWAEPEPAEPSAAPWPAGLADYVSFVLLDFVVVDPALDEVALAHVLTLARDLDVRDAFIALARKELKQTVAGLAKLEERAPSLFKKVAKAADRQEEEAS